MSCTGLYTYNTELQDYQAQDKSSTEADTIQLINMSTSTGSIQGKVYTSRLMLRGATLGDVDALYECFRDGEVMRYW